MGIVSRRLFLLLINEMFTDASAAELCGLPSVLDCEMLLGYFLGAFQLCSPKGRHTELFPHFRNFIGGDAHVPQRVCGGRRTICGS